MSLVPLIVTTLLVLVINIPFGYWRANVKKFSWQWALAIHIPVPLIIAMRIFFNIGFAWYTYLFLVTAFFSGQRIGYYIHQQFTKNHHSISSCLFMDIKRNCC